MPGVSTADYRPPKFLNSVQRYFVIGGSSISSEVES